MRFVVRHRYDLAPEIFWRRVFSDAEYNAALYREGLGFGAFSVDSQETDDAGALLKRVARVRPTLHAPKPVAKLLGDALTYVERGHRDADGRWVTEIVPSRLADKITLRTTMWTEPVGEVCDRIAEFEVQVRIFGLGKAVERFIERTLRESYDKAATFTNAWAEGLADP